MTAEQRNSLIRSALATFGGLIGGWFLSKGWLNQEQLSFLSANAPVLIGMATSLGAGIWAFIARKPSNMVASVAAMPEVSEVKMNNTSAGAALAQAAGSTPAATVTVAAGRF